MAASMMGAGGNTRPGSVESTGRTVVVVGDGKTTAHDEDISGIQFHGKETPQYARGSSSSGNSAGTTPTDTGNYDDRPVSRKSIRLDVAEENFYHSEEMRRTGSAESNTSSKSRENTSPGRHDDDRDVVIPKQNEDKAEDNLGNFVKTEAAMNTINEETKSQVSRENSRPASAVSTKNAALGNDSLLVENDMRLESVTPSNSTIPQSATENLEQKFLSSSPSPVIATEIQSGSQSGSQPMSGDYSLNSSMEVAAGVASSSTGSIEVAKIVAANPLDGMSGQHSRPVSAKREATLQAESSRPASAHSAKSNPEVKTSEASLPDVTTKVAPESPQPGLGASRPVSAQSSKSITEAELGVRPVSASSAKSDTTIGQPASRPASARAATPQSNEQAENTQAVLFFDNGTISIAIIPLDFAASAESNGNSVASSAYNDTPANENEQKSKSPLENSRPISATSQTSIPEQETISSRPVSAKSGCQPESFDKQQDSSRPVSAAKSAVPNFGGESALPGQQALESTNLQHGGTDSRPDSAKSTSSGKQLNQATATSRPVSAKSMEPIDTNPDVKHPNDGAAFGIKGEQNSGSRPVSAISQSAASKPETGGRPDSANYAASADGPTKSPTSRPMSGKSLAEENVDEKQQLLEASRPVSAKSLGSDTADGPIEPVGSRPATAKSLALQADGVQQEKLDPSRPASAKSVTGGAAVESNTSRPTSAHDSQPLAAEVGNSRPESATSSKLDILHVTEVPSLSSRVHSAKEDGTDVEVADERPLSAKSTASIKSQPEPAGNASSAMDPVERSPPSSSPKPAAEPDNGNNFKVIEEEVNFHSNPPSALECLLEEPLNLNTNDDHNAMESGVESSVPLSPDLEHRDDQEPIDPIHQAALEDDYYSMILAASVQSPAGIVERLQRFSIVEQPEGIDAGASGVVTKVEDETDGEKKVEDPEVTLETSAAPEGAEAVIKIPDDTLVESTEDSNEDASTEQHDENKEAEADLLPEAASASVEGNEVAGHGSELVDDKADEGDEMRSSRVSLRDGTRVGKQDHDSGVDENTQALSEHAPSKKTSAVKEGRAPVRKITSRSTSRSKSVSKEDEAQKEAKKVPMNKIQVGTGPSPNLKAVKSKIGSLGNTSYKPGGGNVRIEHKKVEIGEVKPKVGAKNEGYQGPSGGLKKKAATAGASAAPAAAAAAESAAEEKSAPSTATKPVGKKVITSHKLNWSAKSKIGSLENKDYKPKGGDKKIETVKLNFKDKAQSKVASTVNVKHKPGGGNVKNTAKVEEEKPETEIEPVADEKPDIETQKLEFKAESKIGSLDNVKHRPGGGDKPIFEDKEYLRQMSSRGGSKFGSSVGSSAQGSRSLLQTPEPAQNGSEGDKEDNEEVHEEQAENEEEVGESVDNPDNADGDEQTAEESQEDAAAEE